MGPHSGPLQDHVIPAVRRNLDHNRIHHSKGTAFRAQPNFREEEEMVYFVEETKVSYLGEDVQILKEKQKVD